MSLFKCKMCGGTLEFAPGDTVATCEYCGTKQTLPRLDDDKRANLYDRAGHFRRNNEFDKAAGIYEQILSEDNTDAEAYWSLVLCRYGIEYVEDPQTHKRIPTVNRAQYTSIFDDEDYKSAIANADAAQREVYETEAKTINEIQKGILAISQKEEPFDVFICYKETDENGRRTPDSVLANDLYHQLTEEGFKVFFARITLEDKLGSAYEPYIFAALNSAKVMVVLGTKPAYFNAVWVKNEWSRYLALIKGGAKKILIPAYKDMDPYDLPEEFSHLQAQDMSKLGFMQDLIRGIKKLTESDAPKAATVKETVIVGANSAATTPLLERVFLFLEDGKWKDANIYCEKVLDIDPKNAEAYLGKLMAELQVKNRKLLADCDEPFDDRDNFSKVLRFGDEKLEAEMRGYITHINERNENARLTGIYDRAKDLMEHTQAEGYFEEAAKLFHSIPGFRDADSLAVRCDESAILARKESIYREACRIIEYGNYDQAVELLNSIPDYKDAGERIEKCKKDAIYNNAYKMMAWEGHCEKAIPLFEQVRGWRDADDKIKECRERIAQKEAERIAEEKRAKRNKKIGAAVALVASVAILFAILYVTLISPALKRSEANKMLAAGDYADAYAILQELGDNNAIIANKRSRAEACLEQEKYNDAYKLFKDIGDEKAISESKYNRAVALLDAEQYDEAYALLNEVGKDEMVSESRYNRAIELVEQQDYDSAFVLLKGLDRADAQVKLEEIIPLCSEGERLQVAEVGDTVYFGAYEQDNDTSNGKEKIAWLVLAKERDRILVISDKTLDCQPYNMTWSDVTWETCSLRQWLNDTFLNTAFSSAEQALIADTSVSADKNPECSTNPGNTTTDKVFLFSIDEVNQYFDSAEASKCVPTVYAKANGGMTSSAYTKGGVVTYWWWLRSPGDYQFFAAYVGFDGTTSCSGGPVNAVAGGVRPALWINLGE